MENVSHMKELISRLNQAAKVYYQGQGEVMSNFEYDKLYDELLALEKETGITMNNSPTIHVGYETISELPKEQHVQPMLSLNKTKETSAWYQSNWYHTKVSPIASAMLPPAGHDGTMLMDS